MNQPDAFGLNTHPGEQFRILKPGMVEGTHVVEIYVALFHRWHTHGTFSNAQLAKMRVELEGPKLTIILHQFVGPSPYELQRVPMGWKAFLIDTQAGRWNSKSFGSAQIKEMDDTDRLEMATTAYREDEKGFVAVWRSRWDSSG